MKGRAGRTPTMTTELISWRFYLGVLICMNNATRALETIATCMGKMGSMPCSNHEIHQSIEDIRRTLFHRSQPKAERDD